MLPKVEPGHPLPNGAIQSLGRLAETQDDFDALVAHLDPSEQEAMRLSNLYWATKHESGGTTAEASNSNVEPARTSENDLGAALEAAVLENPDDVEVVHRFILYIATLGDSGGTTAVASEGDVEAEGSEVETGSTISDSQSQRGGASTESEVSETESWTSESDAEDETSSEGVSDGQSDGKATSSAYSFHGERNAAASGNAVGLAASSTSGFKAERAAAEAERAVEEAGKAEGPAASSTSGFEAERATADAEKAEGPAASSTASSDGQSENSTAGFDLENGTWSWPPLTLKAMLNAMRSPLAEEPTDEEVLADLRRR